MNRKQWMQGVVLSALVIGTAGVAVAASSAIPGEPAAQPNAEFRNLDVNHDGYLSREETRKIRGFEKPFKEADDNRDGRLDSGEFVKAQSVHERIKAGQYVDDSVITAKVKAALLKDKAVSGTAVSVETDKGTVLLSGFVNSSEQVKRAGEIASGIAGVVNVKNSLVVKS